MSDRFLQRAAAGVQGLHPYVPGKPMAELEREYGVSDIVKLASNENLLGAGPAAREAMRKALDEVGFYPDANGFDLKRRLAAFHDVDPSCLTLGNGSNDVLVLLAQAFLNPGDPVVYSQYAFAVYKIATQMQNAEHREVPALGADSDMPLGHDLDAMAAQLDDSVKLVFIANPNNPTGTWVNPDRLREFIASAPKHTLVVVDEAYFEYADENERVDVSRWVKDFDNLVVTRTFSKAYGLSGVRVGYAISHPEVADLLNRVRQPFNVNNVALAAAEAALGDHAFLQRTRQINDDGMAQMKQACQRWGLTAIPSACNFLLIDLGREAAPIFDALLRRGVIVRPVANYGLPNHIRVTIGQAHQNQAFIDAMDAVLAN
jgi:histidinol-phosphate aminotransferase